MGTPNDCQVTGLFFQPGEKLLSGAGTVLASAPNPRGVFLTSIFGASTKAYLHTSSLCVPSPQGLKSYSHRAAPSDPT